MISSSFFFFFFFFNDTATTEIYTLSLHDALPISSLPPLSSTSHLVTYLDYLQWPATVSDFVLDPRDRKSTRLNSSHVRISYAVFCLKKKNTVRTCRAFTKLSKQRVSLVSQCKVHR